MLLDRQEGLVGQVGGTGSGQGLRVVVFVLRCGARARGRSESGSMVAEWHTGAGRVGLTALHRAVASRGRRCLTGSRLLSAPLAPSTLPHCAFTTISTCRSRALLTNEVLPLKYCASVTGTYNMPCSAQHHPLFAHSLLLAITLSFNHFHLLFTQKCNP